MATEFKLPDLGEGVEAGDVVSVLVAEGDTIEIDQSVVELETDKALVEVPSSVAGTITKIHISAGDRVPVGSLLISVEEGEKSVPEEPEAKAPTPAPKEEPEPTARAPEPTPTRPPAPTSNGDPYSRSPIHAAARARTRCRSHPGRWLWSRWTHLTRRYQSRCARPANRWSRANRTRRIARLLEMGQHRTPTPQQSSANYRKKYEPGLATGGSCHAI